MERLKKNLLIFNIVCIGAAISLATSCINAKETSAEEKTSLELLSAEKRERDKDNTNLSLAIQNQKLSEANQDLVGEVEKLKTEISDEASKKAAEELEAKAIAASKATSNYTSSYSGQVLSPSAGAILGPSGKETYYNLNMNVCIQIMRNLGYDAENYPHWIREDGAKMLGSFVMVAANYQLRPRGTIVQTSLGAGIVVDTGGFADSNATQLDICVNW